RTVNVTDKRSVIPADAPPLLDAANSYCITPPRCTFTVSRRDAARIVSSCAASRWKSIAAVNVFPSDCAWKSPSATATNADVYQEVPPAIFSDVPPAEDQSSETEIFAPARPEMFPAPSDNAIDSNDVLRARFVASTMSFGRPTCPTNHESPSMPASSGVGRVGKVV